MVYIPTEEDLLILHGHWPRPWHPNPFDHHDALGSDHNHQLDNFLLLRSSKMTEKGSHIFDGKGVPGRFPAAAEEAVARIPFNTTPFQGIYSGRQRGASAEESVG
ncbi:hypothetical protein Dimus_012117 [Dionaea muscipula]